MPKCFVCYEGSLWFRRNGFQAMRCLNFCGLLWLRKPQLANIETFPSALILAHRQMIVLKIVALCESTRRLASHLSRRDVLQFALTLLRMEYYWFCISCPVVDFCFFGVHKEKDHTLSQLSLSFQGRAQTPPKKTSETCSWLVSAIMRFRKYLSGANYWLQMFFMVPGAAPSFGLAAQ